MVNVDLIFWHFGDCLQAAKGGNHTWPTPRICSRKPPSPPFPESWYPRFLHASQLLHQLIFSGQSYGTFSYSSYKLAAFSILYMSLCFAFVLSWFLCFSCKRFADVAEDNRVYQRVSLAKFDIVPWTTNPKVSMFVKKCRRCKNPEALYRKGVVSIWFPALFERQTAFSIHATNEEFSVGH